MPIVLWDASGLVKRYFAELGTDSVDAIFEAVPRSQMQSTLWGFAETFAILHRKRNSGLLNQLAFAKAVTKLQDEIIEPGEVGLFNIEAEQILAGLSFVVRHNLNSNDAAILATYLRYQKSPPPVSLPCLLVTADQRLMRASEAEGLATLNPERVSPAEVTMLLTRNV